MVCKEMKIVAVAFYKVLFKLTMCEINRKPAVNLVCGRRELSEKVVSYSEYVIVSFEGLWKF